VGLLSPSQPNSHPVGGPPPPPPPPPPGGGGGPTGGGGGGGNGKPGGKIGMTHMGAPAE
jgi:hypothetical protein